MWYIGKTGTKVLQLTEMQGTVSRGTSHYALCLYFLWVNIFQVPVFIQCVLCIWCAVFSQSCFSRCVEREQCSHVFHTFSWRWTETMLNEKWRNLEWPRTAWISLILSESFSSDASNFSSCLTTSDFVSDNLSICFYQWIVYKGWFLKLEHCVRITVWLSSRSLNWLNFSSELPFVLRLVY